jgi:hypothetical protein
MPVVLGHVLEVWAATYSDSAILRASVTFCHFARLMAGGGLAIAADRSTLRVASEPDQERAAHLDDLHVLHRVVVAGLSLTFASGLLMVAADLDAMVASRIFWTKMALVAVLLVNGLAMTRAERAARDMPSIGWPRLRRAALISAVLWFLIVFVSTMLTTTA